jgi:hypothetical protein
MICTYVKGENKLRPTHVGGLSYSAPFQITCFHLLDVENYFSQRVIKD